METINKKVVSYCAIPEEITEKHWISEYKTDSYVEVHIEETNPDELSEWLIKNYPELEDLDESFFIHIDY